MTVCAKTGQECGCTSQDLCPIQVIVNVGDELHDILADALRHDGETAGEKEKT